MSGIFCANELIKLRHLQGRLRDAMAAADAALAWVAEAGWQQLPPASALHIWRGNVLIEQGDLAGAAEELTLAHRLTQAGITTARAHTFLARLHLLQGDREHAKAAIASVETICRDWERGGERVFFDAYVARPRLLAGDLEPARRWAESRPPWDSDEPHSYFRELELLTLARVAVIAGPAPDGLSDIVALIGWLRDKAATAGRGLVVIETLAVEALAQARSGDLPTALNRIDEALALAAPERFVGLFADLGAPMAALLTQRVTRTAPGDPLLPYLRQLLGEQAPTLRAVPQQLGDADALTERELEVLRLFAAGMTSAEIARHFVVSVNTVKTQLKSIYSKLDIHSRAELVARARALALIP